MVCSGKHGERSGSVRKLENASKTHVGSYKMPGDAVCLSSVCSVDLRVGCLYIVSPGIGTGVPTLAQLGLRSKYL